MKKIFRNILFITFLVSMVMPVWSHYEESHHNHSNSTGASKQGNHGDPLDNIVVDLNASTQSKYFDIDSGFLPDELEKLKQEKDNNYQYMSRRIASEGRLNISIGINPVGLPNTKKSVWVTKQFKEHERQARGQAVKHILKSLEKTAKKEFDPKYIRAVQARGRFWLNVNQAELDLLYENPDVIWFMASGREPSEEEETVQRSWYDPNDCSRVEKGFAEKEVDRFLRRKAWTTTWIKYSMRKQNSEFWKISIRINDKGSPACGEEQKEFFNERIDPILNSLNPADYKQLPYDSTRAISLEATVSALRVLENNNNVIYISDRGKPRRRPPPEQPIETLDSADEPKKKLLSESDALTSASFVNPKIGIIDIGFHEDKYTPMNSRIVSGNCRSQFDEYTVITVSHQTPQVFHEHRQPLYVSFCSNGGYSSNNEEYLPRYFQTHESSDSIPQHSGHPVYQEFVDYHGTNVAKVIVDHEPDVRFHTATTGYYYRDSLNTDDIDYDTNDVIEHLDDMKSISGLAAANISLATTDIDPASEVELCKDNIGQSTITAVVNKNIAVVAAAGNNGNNAYVGWPACLSNVIAVASVQNGAITNYSNLNGGVDFLANDEIKSVEDGSDIDGTSLAAPVIAAAFATLKQAKPTATLAEMRQALHIAANNADSAIYYNGTKISYITKAVIQSAANCISINDCSVIPDSDPGGFEDDNEYNDTGSYGDAYGDNNSANYTFEIDFSSLNTALSGAALSTTEGTALNGLLSAASGAALTDGRRDIVLSFTGKTNEAVILEVLINGVVVKNSGVFGGTKYFNYILNRNFFNAGNNTIVIRPYGSSWGVKNVNAKFNPVVSLAVDQIKTTTYGYSQNPNRYTGLRTSFNLPTVDSDYRFSVDAWDIDVSNETKLYLNNKLLEYLSTAASSTWTGVQKFRLKEVDLKTGKNTLEFVQRYPGTDWSGFQDEKWAVRNMLIEKNSSIIPILLLLLLDDE